MFLKVAKVIGVAVAFGLIWLVIGVSLFFGYFIVNGMPAKGSDVPPVVAVTLNAIVAGCPLGMAILGAILAICLVIQDDEVPKT